MGIIQSVLVFFRALFVGRAALAAEDLAVWSQNSTGPVGHACQMTSGRNGLICDVERRLVPTSP